MNLTNVRQGLAEALELVPGLRVVDHVPDAIPVGETVTAVAVISPGVDPFIDYYRSFARGLVEINYDVQLVVARVDPQSAQLEMDALLSAGVGAPRSVPDAIRAGRTLGGVAADTIPYSAGQIGAVQVGDTAASYLSALLSVTVFVSD